MTPQELMAAADAAYDAGRFDAARGMYARLAAVAPAHPAPLFNLGAALRDGDKPAAAYVWFWRAARVLPAPLQALTAAAACALKLGKLDDAVAAMTAAVGAAPEDATAAQGLADAVKTRGDNDRAAALYRRALALDPAGQAIWFNLGVTLGDACRHDAAAAALRRAVTLAPADAAAQFSLACELLTLGRLEEGFAAYESRFAAGDGPPAKPWPWWRGEPLAGKRILLLAEQGHGDGLQFARYTPMVAAAGAAAVGIEAPPALTRLLATVDGVTRVHPLGGAPAADYDLFCPLMSLPAVFGTALATIPASVPYVADRFDGDERLERWFPADDRRLKIGLAWSGEVRRHDPRQFAANRRRSLALTDLAPLLATSGARFYSLQLGEPRGELAASSFAGLIVDPMDDVADFTDSAALVGRLDLVISVCTATAHLAGALGKPLWLPLARRACWRWLTERDDSPWYPSARLFRQTTAGDWSGPVAEMRMRLDEIICRRNK